MNKLKKIIIIPCLLLLTGCSTTNYKNGEVNVLNWSSYIPDEIIKDFEKEYQIKVNYGTYSSNEELLAKLSSSKEGTYDLIFPSDYMVELMINKNMLEPLNLSKLTNISNINKIFLNQEYDKNNTYSLPFLAATVVIAVNRNNIKDNITTYGDLQNINYKNNIVLLDDQRIIIGISLQALGYSMNETDIQKLEQAKDWLLDLKKNIKAFDSDSPKTFLITNEVDIGVMWNAEAILAKQENNQIEIIYPEEGHTISIDNYSIVKNSKNQENAYLLIDYLLRNDVNRKITEQYPYISTTYANQTLATQELNHILAKGSYIKNIGSNISLYDKLWADIK